jgi:hypothetical protein
MAAILHDLNRPPRVLVIGGASWNTMIQVERFPEPRSATIFPPRITGHDPRQNQAGRQPMTTQNPDDLDELIGTWEIEAVAPWASPDDPRGRVTFERLGDHFIVERWEVPVPEAPDGIAIIGWDEGRGTTLQHYFDTRGVARIYEMSLRDGVWKLSRTTADYAPLDFKQRFEGRLSADGRQIDGTWEIDEGAGWAHDFNLVYRRVG